MIFVRGIKGNIKLNPVITIWGGLVLLAAVIVGWTGYEIMSFQSKVARCQERGGIWVGYAGSGRLMPTGECVMNKTRQSKEAGK